MSYWQGNGKAAGYSREVEAALNAVRAAESALLATMQAAYPKDSVVRVVHYRGQFFGTVLGHDTTGTRICVRNNHTGKTSKWWAAHVEVLNLAQHEEST
ncbi:hypothetical protein GmRootA79_16520 [Acidovorax sp. A79]|uniref:hypothetical protein n=1 Tax=Acidovorax sp. A79 TaxID=3056107 RepID=UPI0034E891AB